MALRTGRRFEHLLWLIENIQCWPKTITNSSITSPGPRHASALSHMEKWNQIKWRTNNNFSITRAATGKTKIQLPACDKSGLCIWNHLYRRLASPIGCSLVIYIQSIGGCRVTLRLTRRQPAPPPCPADCRLRAHWTAANHSALTTTRLEDD